MSSDALRLLKEHVQRLDAPGAILNDLLPQSHREEVEWFSRVAAGIASEQGTITPEEFQEFQSLLPSLFPMLTRDMRARKDAAYLERNRLVAALSKVYPSGKAKTAIEGWSEDWHNCVYIDLPTGQASWHIHDSQMWLFEHLGPYTKPWDGHTTDEKYERLEALPGPRIYTTPKGIVVAAPHGLPADAWDQIASLLDRTQEVLVTSLPVEIVSLPEGVRLLLVSAVGVDDTELQNLYHMVHESLSDPDYTIVTNYHINITGAAPLKENA